MWGSLGLTPITIDWKLENIDHIFALCQLGRFEFYLLLCSYTYC